MEEMKELVKMDSMQISIGKSGNIEIKGSDIKLSKREVGFIKKVQELITEG